MAFVRWRCPLCGHKMETYTPKELNCESCGRIVPLEWYEKLPKGYVNETIN
ncbi:MAG: hypothetical protein GY861_04255 [bacterium]|nr:hypothetical protein [bacterium]